MKYCCCFLFSLVLHCALYLNFYRRECELKQNLRILLRRKADKLARIDGSVLFISLAFVQLKPNISFEIRHGTRNFGMIRWKKLKDISVLALKRIFDFIVCYLSSIYFWWLFHLCKCYHAFFLQPSLSCAERVHFPFTCHGGAFFRVFHFLYIKLYKHCAVLGLSCFRSKWRASSINHRPLLQSINRWTLQMIHPQF